MLAGWPLVILASTRRLQKERTTPAVPVTESAGCRVGMAFTHTRERAKQSLVRHRPPEKGNPTELGAKSVAPNAHHTAPRHRRTKE